ncbi:hypothetical protein K439DRAFT_1623605 [Ramaria rubella]|nr:hypothetical protein K439DRAFT_1623605 [Ramaria rubella]
MSMLSLLTCSASRFDDLDPYPGLSYPDVSPPSSPLRQRRSSKSFSFIIRPATKKRRVAKMSIGTPTDFRHDFHLGKDVAGDGMINLWDTTRWQQELEKESRSSLPSSLASSIAPSTTPSAKPNASKRNSITPQKRKPVPSLVPDIPDLPFPAPVPCDIPLPPSPTTSECLSEESPAYMSSEPASEPEPLVPLLDSPCRAPSTDGEKPYVSDAAKKRWDDAMDEIAQALKEDDSRGEDVDTAALVQEVAVQLQT